MNPSTETPQRRAGRPPTYGPRVAFSLRLDPSFYESLQEAAEAEGVSLNVFLNRAAEAELDRRRGQQVA